MTPLKGRKEGIEDVDLVSTVNGKERSLVRGRYLEKARSWRRDYWTNTKINISLGYCSVDNFPRKANNVLCDEGKGTIRDHWTLKAVLQHFITWEMGNVFCPLTQWFINVLILAYEKSQRHLCCGFKFCCLYLINKHFYCAKIISLKFLLITSVPSNFLMQWIHFLT